MTCSSLRAFLLAELGGQERQRALLDVQCLSVDRVLAVPDESQERCRNGDILAPAQEPLQPPSPSLTFDVDPRLQLPQTVGVEHAVLHALHCEVRHPAMVCDDARDTREHSDGAAVDPLRRQQWRASHVKILRLPTDPKPGLLHVLHPQGKFFVRRVTGMR